MIWHGKVFLSFTAAIIGWFLLFGYIAFDRATHSEASKDAHILMGITRLAAEDIAVTLSNHGDDEMLRQAVVGAGAAEYATALLNHSGQVIAFSSHSPAAGELKTAQLPTLDMIGELPKTGEFFFNLQRYLWASYPLANTPFTFVTLSRTGTTGPDAYFEALAVPMIISVVLLLSYFYWCKIIHLNAQRTLDRLEKELLEQRFHDPVSELPQRALFLDRAAQTLQLSQREGRNFVIMCLRLNPLTEILQSMNQTLQAQVIKAIAGKLQQTLRDSDSFSYSGDGIFLAHMPSTDGEDAKTIAHKLVASFRENLSIDEHSFFLRCHIGIAVFPSHGEEVDTLLDHARLAMNVCTQANNSYICYDKNLDHFNIQRLSFINSLRRAINQNKLELYFQPKIDLNSMRVTGAEALVRWRLDDGTLVLPDEFIPLAEQTGLISQLTQWVLNTAMRNCAELQTRWQHLSIAVNISAYNLNDHQLEQHIFTQLSTWKIAPHTLTLELTESAMMRNQARAMELLTRITTQGAKIAVDDFGTGYSSLNYLRKLPLHELKIDKSFVVNMGQDKDDAVIVQSIIDLAHDMGLQVVAEGIENNDILLQLLAMKCDTGQGYFISPPMTLEKFIIWLENNGRYQPLSQEQSPASA